MIVVNTRDLRRQTAKGYSCRGHIADSACPFPPNYYKAKNQSADRRVGRKPLPLAGKTTGRFIFLEWIKKIGWKVRCKTCDGWLIFKNSQTVCRYAMEPCAGECLHG